MEARKGKRRRPLAIYDLRSLQNGIVARRTSKSSGAWVSKSGDFRPFSHCADLEVGGTAGLETCGTEFYRVSIYDDRAFFVLERAGPGGPPYGGTKAASAGGQQPGVTLSRIRGIAGDYYLELFQGSQLARQKARRFPPSSGL